MITHDGPCYIIAEIGINHNGDLGIAKQLIAIAAQAGCDAVKFQKRTPHVVYTEEELARPRESVFGDTNGDLKRGLEFGQDEYEQIDAHCLEHDIDWFASCWDHASLEFISQFQPPYFKIASATLTDDNLVAKTAQHGPVILSTGMSTLEEIYQAVLTCGYPEWLLLSPYPGPPTPPNHFAVLRGLTGEPQGTISAILHCTSTYPCPTDEINLACLGTLSDAFTGIPIGYSGHEKGLATTLAAVAMGARVIERHITLDRSMWGSDQAASIEPQGLQRLVRDIRTVEAAVGDGIKRVYDSELPIRDKLRRVHA